MNITIITTSIGYGGAEKQVCFLANGLAERGHNVSIINMNVYGSFLKARTQNFASNIKIDTLHTHLPSPLTNIEWVLKSIHYLRKTKAELVIGFTFTPNYIAQICGNILHIPSIISERVDPYHYISNGWLDQIRVRWMNKADGGVFQTEGAKSYYSEVLQHKSVVIPNPIARPSSIEPVYYNTSQKHIISIGRFDDNQQKRYDILLQAFSEFHVLHPDYKLYLYGSGPFENQIKQWVNELNITDSVEFKGVAQSSMQIMSESGGIFLITSDYEGISNSLLEAMAVGMPVVSTDHTPGGARLLIQDHENGLLTPIRDTKKLCEALCEYAENPTLAIHCGKNAQNVLECFAPDRMLDMWNDYVNSFAKQK